MHKGKIAAFGELLVRLEAQGYHKLIQSEAVNISYTGAEANVCVSLATFGESTQFVTKLPNNEVARVALSRLRMHGVGVEHVLLGGERMGLYYLERGASQRPSKVTYDRKHSALSQSVAADWDWDKIFEGVHWFHITGITPALGSALPEVCEEACKVARQKGITISCDPNYRPSLWTHEEYAPIIRRLVQYTDLLIGSALDAEKTLGASTNKKNANGTLTSQGYEDLARQICVQYGCKQVAFTQRENLSASDNRWAAMLYDGKNAYFSKEYLIHLVDRVGGGDSFSAGLIYALIHAYEPQSAIEFATAASCLKHTMERDFNLATVEEVLHLAQGDGTGKIRR